MQVTVQERLDAAEQCCTLSGRYSWKGWRDVENLEDESACGDGRFTRHYASGSSGPRSVCG